MLSILLLALLFYPDLFVIAEDFRPEDHLSDEGYGEFFSFRTEPSFLSPKPKIKKLTSDQSLLAPGYIFVAPYGGLGDWHAWGFGSHIYTNDGDLVFNGLSESNIWWGQYKAKAINFRPCDYFGETGRHLCWSDITVEDDIIISSNRIFDNTYTQATQDFSDIAGFRAPNEHEFKTIRNGQSLLQLVYSPREVDLSRYSGPTQGWMRDCCFQDIDITSREENFKWCTYDWLGLSDSQVQLNPLGKEANNTILAALKTTHIAGNGSQSSPWDYCHMNSVELTKDGDYIVSIRHFDQIVKIAGVQNIHNVEPGTIIWRLGGLSSSFEVETVANFSRQHHASHITSLANGDEVLLFDNAFDGVNPSSSTYSTAKHLRVNNDTREATLVHQYDHPDRQITEKEGSAQQLYRNDNVFVGWGGLPHYTEFSKDGDTLLHVELGPEYPNSYRAFKSTWTGFPKWPPKALAYKQSCDQLSGSSPTTVYISWNGATEVKRWRLSGSSKDSGNDWVHLQTVKKNGFETHTTLDITGFVPRILVEGLDDTGTILGSVISQTFVPLLEIGANCDMNGCEPRFEYSRNLSMSATCTAVALKRHTNYTKYLIAVIMAVLVGLLIRCWYIPRLQVKAKRWVAEHLKRSSWKQKASQTYELVPQDELKTEYG